MSLFSRMGRFTRLGYENMIRSRQMQADRYVTGALLNFDDDTLARAGYDRRQLEKKSAAFSV